MNENENSNCVYEKDLRIYEYTSAANPNMSKIPVLTHDCKLHENGETRIIPFDLSNFLKTQYQATSPNLLASFIKICDNEEIDTYANSTSQIFYVIRGKGYSIIENEIINWSEGDLFVVPYYEHKIYHYSMTDSSLYWINDEPLLKYLGVKPNIKKFDITYFSRERMYLEIEKIVHNNKDQELNRLGILLGNRVTELSTKTITHTMWSLLNVLPANNVQKPHRHNSVALDLCVFSSGEGVYTLMGEEIGENGNIINPIKCDWIKGSVFVTPPGWWHSHHNETGEDAYVLPIQDAGLYTYQRTLDIRFSV
jgi:gentisate 1,2-dioxygenase